MRVEEIARFVGGEIVGDPDREISNVKKIDEAGTGDISFIASPKYVRYHVSTHASALIVGDDFETTREDITYIRTPDPYTSFILVLRTFGPAEECPDPGIHPSAVIAEDVELGANLSIGAHVVIGAGSIIGDDTTIYPNVVLGRRVSVGRQCIIHPNVTLYRGTQLGDRVLIHSGAVLGADGFGFVPKADGSWEKIPQGGIVVVENDAEIGANTTIDRATLGETRIGEGVKIDNLVHIAHNVVIGKHSALAAQAGISGSTRIGESNLIAGQVGIVGHIETAANVIIEAQSGVSKSISKAGRYFGHPVKEHAQALRQEGALRQLPDLLQEIREMRNRLAQLEAALGVTEKE